MKNNILESLYEDAIEWIALNDEPTLKDLTLIKAKATTLLISDIFDKAEARVANDIKDFRDEMGI